MRVPHLLRGLPCPPNLPVPTQTHFLHTCMLSLLPEPIHTNKLWTGFSVGLKLSIHLLLIHLWYQSSYTHVFKWGPNTSWSECNLLDLSKTKPTFFNRCSVILVVGSSSSTTWKWLWMWHFHSANPTFRKPICLVFLLGTHQTASQGPVFTFITKFSIVFNNLQDIWREQTCIRKGRRLWNLLLQETRKTKILIEE